MKILDYCAIHGSITNRDANVKLDINSPTKRISELVKAGYDVQKVKETRVNSSGREVRYVRYYIQGGENHADI
jgi:hypothetical protein